MTNETERGRQKMTDMPFSPLPSGATHDGQVEHALNYIAFYLSEIEKHLARLADTRRADGTGAGEGDTGS